MALEEYKDVYDLDQYVNRVQNITSQLNTLVSGGVFDSLKSRVKGQIQNLQKKERALLELLGAKNIEELNNKIQKYKAAVINLSGPQLNEEIVYMLKEKSEKDFNVLKQKVDTIVDKLIEEQKPKTQKEFEKVILNYLNQSLSGEIRMGVTSFSATHGIGGDDMKVHLPEITSNQRERWKQLVEKESKEDGLLGEIDIDFQNHEDSQSIYFDWKVETHNLTPTQAKELDKKNRLLINY